MLFEFRDSLLLEYKGWWFLWESAWESFRPIDGVRWDGSRFQVDDNAYCSDPSDEFYGYGTAQMKELCELLNDNRERIPNSVETLPMKDLEWFYDRRVSMTTCAPRDKISWKRLVHNKPRTCRKMPRGKKFTRRAL